MRVVYDLTRAVAALVLKPPLPDDHLEQPDDYLM